LLFSLDNSQYHLSRLPCSCGSICECMLCACPHCEITEGHADAAACTAWFRSVMLSGPGAAYEARALVGPPQITGPSWSASLGWRSDAVDSGRRDARRQAGWPCPAFCAGVRGTCYCWCCGVPWQPGSAVAGANTSEHSTRTPSATAIMVTASTTAASSLALLQAVWRLQAADRRGEPRPPGVMWRRRGRLAAAPAKRPGAAVGRAGMRWAQRARLLRLC